MNSNLFKEINHKTRKLLLLTLTSGVAVATLFQCTNKNPAAIPETIDFNFDVRPILVQKCYHCHGPDPSSRKANLRLDTFEGATALLEEGTRAIVPGYPGKSELIERIAHADPDMKMPPPESNLELSAYEIGILKKWIDQGAEWKPHWAFIKPELEEPVALDPDQSANQIDGFILEKVKQNGLEPEPIADKNTLIRRVSYLLTGLPPTSEMIDKYTSDQNPDAYEKMVDHYLGSADFGERWARHWMDVVRYAETKGHEFDYPIIGAWKYRDYLIRAFNNDVPYDQLVKEHLAGDMVDTVRWNPENGINESQLGTVFYALSEGTHSPVDIRKDEADRIDNMIDVTTKTFQGLTVSCARCHDHKFDPIPTADYYALYGVMESSRFSLKPANFTAEKMEDLGEIEALKDSIRSMIGRLWLSEYSTVSGNQVINSEESKITPREEKGEYQIIADFRGDDLDGWKSDGLAFGEKTTLGEPVFDNQGRNLVGIAEGKATSRMIAKGLYGVLRSPNFVIDKDFIGVKALGENATIRIIVDNFQLIQYPIYGGLDKKVNSGKWKHITFEVAAWKGHKAYIEILPGFYKKQAYKLPQNAYIDVEYVITFDNEWPQSVELIRSDKADPQQAIQDWAADKCSPQQVKLLNNLLGRNLLGKQFPKTYQFLERNKQLAGKLNDSSYFAGVDDGYGINSHIFNRGNHNDLSSEPVPRGFLSAISSESPAFGSPGSGRMELVDAILDPDNPLTSRVMVNRIWHHLFGRGIVETVDNFGLQGKLPTHPELLDYLAFKFQNEGWSIKKMIKFIVMSNTFRRSVNVAEHTKKIDPGNLWLSHFPIRRLESEAIRDGLLAITGNLDTARYGPPVPVYLTSFMKGRGRPKNSGPLDGNGRRSIYLEVRRNFLQPMMLTFDRPIPFSTFGKRNVTNVPAQSLILMNDPFVIHQAEVMAKNLINLENMGVEERLSWIYIRALGRQPIQVELEQAKTFISSLAQSHQVKEADMLNSTQVWKDYCHSVFNLKEFIYLL